MIIDEKKYEILKKAQKITWVDYLDEARQLVNEEYCYYIEPSVLINTIEDLLCEIDKQKEEYERLEDSIDAYYNPKSPYEIYGINESDFH